MGQFSLGWFKSSKQKELQELLLEEQRIKNELLRKELFTAATPVYEPAKTSSTADAITICKPYLNVKLVNDVLTIVLNDGSIISKPNATAEDFNKVRTSTCEDQLFTIVGSAEIVEEKRLRELELQRLRNIKAGINRLGELYDFTVDGDSVYLTGIQRSLPQLMVEKFTEIVGRYTDHNGYTLQSKLNQDDEYQSLKRFFMWCCLNPRAEVAHELYRFLQENSFRITKQGFFVALRNVVTLHGSNELVQFVSNTYNKVKAVWKKSPDNYHVFLENGEYKLVHTDDMYEDKVLTSTTCPECEGEGQFWNNWDDDEEMYGDDREECENCEGMGEVEEYEYIISSPVDHGQDLGTLTALYLDLPNRAENRFTDDWTKTFDIRIGKPVTMPMANCNWSTQDCAAAGLHFTADQIHYVGCGDQSVLVLINPMKVVGIGEHKGRCYEYFPIMTVPREEATEILHDLDFDTLALDEHYVVSELENLTETVQGNFAAETQKYSFNLPHISSAEVDRIIMSLDDMKDALSSRVSEVD
jgi:hypothetical protein